MKSKITHIKLEKDTIKIGKFIIDTLTNSLYSNPLDLYRELMQNALDSVTKKVSVEKPSYKPWIKTISNKQKSHIAVADNGIGFENEEDFLESMLSIGNSKKILGVDRGYRGVGRLAGAYIADKISFVWMDDGEARVIEWNTKTLRNWMLSTASLKITASEVIHRSVQYMKMPYDELMAKYEINQKEIIKGDMRFIAILKIGRGEHKEKNKSLFDYDELRRYMIQTFPLPYEDFAHKKLAESITDQELFRKNKELFKFIYTDGLGKTSEDFLKKSFKDVKDIDFLASKIKLPKNYTGPEIKGWIGFYATNKTIRDSELQRGILVRHMGITIGDSNFLAKFGKTATRAWAFKWIVGEIEIVDTENVHPTSSRNDFVFNERYSKLDELFIEISAQIEKMRREYGKLIGLEKKLVKTRDDESTIEKIEKSKKTITGLEIFGDITKESISKKVMTQFTKDINPDSPDNQKFTSKQIMNASIKILKNYNENEDDVLTMATEIVNELEK